VVVVSAIGGMPSRCYGEVGLGGVPGPGTDGKDKVRLYGYSSSEAQG